MQGQNQDKKVVLTGGHAATTAAAVVEEIKRQKKPWDLHWIGSRQAIEGKGIATFESKILPLAGVSFHTIITGRLQRRFTVWTIPSLVKIPIGLFQSFFLLISIKPSLIVSFGGFAAFPVVVVGKLLGVPIIIHEQTAAAGLANKLCAPFAKRIAISRNSSKKYYPAKKTILIGNPVAKEISNISPKEKLSATPVVFVTGGSRGSQRLNDLVTGNIKGLLERYKIIHQTGRLDFEKIKSDWKKLDVVFRKRYVIYANVKGGQMARFYAKADIIVARAGANTVSEIAVTARPAILMPIPWSYENEQYKNAHLLEEKGAAFILDQDKATPSSLASLLKKVVKNWKKMRLAMDDLLLKDVGASKNLVKVMEESIL